MSNREDALAACLRVVLSLVPTPTDVTTGSPSQQKQRREVMQTVNDARAMLNTFYTERNEELREEIQSLRMSKEEAEGEGWAVIIRKEEKRTCSHPDCYHEAVKYYVIEREKLGKHEYVHLPRCMNHPVSTAIDEYPMEEE